MVEFVLIPLDENQALETDEQAMAGFSLLFMFCLDVLTKL